MKTQICYRTLLNFSLVRPIGHKRERCRVCRRVELRYWDPSSAAANVISGSQSCHRWWGVGVASSSVRGKARS